MAATNYPLWRKEELKAVNGECFDINDPTERYFQCKSFMKMETYAEYKYPRAINSRSDEFKCEVGPIFKLIEEQVFKLDWFIKKIPVADRPAYIVNQLYREGAEYYATDYTAFEANFVKKLMESCEFVMYEYMTKHLSNGKEFMNLIKKVLLGDNVCVFKHFDVSVPATRMSGEMCTSLGNGFSNLMFMLFMCKKHGVTEVAGVVEGDDGFFTGKGNFPTEEDFKKLGLMLKMERHTEISKASFCGLIFDEEELANVTDPKEVLASFAWVSARYKTSKSSKLRALLRCKSLSLAYQYPGCPIIQELAIYGLRMTRGHNIRPIIDNDRTMSMWDREQLLEAIAHPILHSPVGPRTRALVEDKFDISIDSQLKIEAYLKNKDDLLPLDVGDALGDIPDSWTDYADRYVHLVDVCDPQVDRPPDHHPQDDRRREVEYAMVFMKRK